MSFSFSYSRFTQHSLSSHFISFPRYSPLLLTVLLFPASVHVNRGNHEDYLMNKRYGFEKEVLLKYGPQGGLLMRAFSAVFTLLPLAAVINSSVLVVHAVRVCVLCVCVCVCVCVVCVYECVRVC